MPRAWYDPYGIFPSPKPHRRIRHRRPQSINRFDAIGGNKPSSGCRMAEMAMEFFFYVDNAITESIASMASEWSQTGGLFRPASKIMELSMHGIPWLGGTAMAIFFTESRVAAHLLINLFFGKIRALLLAYFNHMPLFCVRILALLLDLLVVCILKLTFRRPRPRGNRGNMIAEAPYVDQFSFPSGHSSRAAMLTKLLITLTTMELNTKLMVSCFPISLGMSRIMLGRHYFSDVVAGLLIGLVECDIATYFWLSPETCLKIWRFIRREPYE